MIFCGWIKENKKIFGPLRYSGEPDRDRGVGGGGGWWFVSNACIYYLDQNYRQLTSNNQILTWYATICKKLVMQCNSTATGAILRHLYPSWELSDLRHSGICYFLLKSNIPPVAPYTLTPSILPLPLPTAIYNIRPCLLPIELLTLTS